MTSLCDLVDAACDAKEIHEASKGPGHVPIIDVNPRRDRALREEMKREARALRACGFVMPESVRYRNRSGVERTSARLKDALGGRHVRVRGHAKVFGHLMFGLLALTVDQLMRLAVPGDGSDDIDSFRKSAGKAGERRGAAIARHVRIPFLPRRKGRPGIRQIREARRELDHAADQAQQRSTIQLVNFARGSVLPFSKELTRNQFQNAF